MNKAIQQMGKAITNPVTWLGVVFFVIIGVAATSIDNSPRPTPAEEDAAFEEWYEMPLGARKAVCNIFIDDPQMVRTSMVEEGLTQTETRARLDLMESVCN